MNAHIFEIEMSMNAIDTYYYFMRKIYKQIASASCSAQKSLQQIDRLNYGKNMGDRMMVKNVVTKYATFSISNIQQCQSVDAVIFNFYFVC